MVQLLQRMSDLSANRNRYRMVVYGTLKRDQSNHAHYLSDAVFLGEDTLDAICLYDLGEYPGARRERSDGIMVEVFEVDEQQLAALDELEEVDLVRPEQGLYRREPIATRFGTAWIYLYNASIEDCPVIRRGGWRQR